MNFLVVLSCVLAASVAAPLEGEQTVDVVQDTLGNYMVAVRTADLTKVEERHPDGSVIGEYSYPDPNGVIQTFKYVAGKGGFQVIEGPLPVAPVDSSVPVPENPELIAARNEHLALYNAATPEREARELVPVAPAVPVDLVAPAVPVDLVAAAVPVDSVAPAVPVDSVAPVHPSIGLLLPASVVQTGPSFALPAVPLDAPVPVQDSPEVQAAKEAHFAAHAAARALLL